MAITPTPAAPRAPRHFLVRCFRALAWLLVGIILAVMLAWEGLAVTYTNLTCAPPRWIAAGIVVAASLGVLIFFRRRLYRFGAFALIFAGVLAFFLSPAPSNERDWDAGVAKLPSIVYVGDTVTIHDVRNFNYRSATDFDARWEDRTYDLTKVRTVDFMLVYWGSKAIAHVMFSFGFEDGRYLAVSIEARREACESYSSVQGFFRQYELIYVFADERDVIRLRTDFLDEQVYMYRVHASPANARETLVSYLDSANALRLHPEWYNALTTNCATSVLPHIRAGGGKGQWSLDILFSGYAARVGYANGKLNDAIPFEELEARSLVNPAAVAAGDGSDFSAKIRANLPFPPPWTGPETDPLKAPTQP